MMNAPPPQISFSLGNPDAPNTVYISTDPAQNALTLALTANVAVALTPAIPVPPADAGSAGGSLFYLDLSALGIDAARFGDFMLQGDGWTAKTYPADGLICFSPKAAISLVADQAVLFNLRNFVLPKTPSTPAVALALDIYGAPPVARGAYPSVASTQVAAMPPPGGDADLRTALSATVSPMAIVLSQSDQGAPVANQLALVLSQVPGGPTARAGDETVFTLSVVYAKDQAGYGALMAPDQGKLISIPAPQGGAWTASNIDGLQGRSWQLVPASGTTLPAAGGNPVSFDLSPIVSYLQPGPSVMLLSYSGIAGFADGAFALTLLKEPHVLIDSFTATPALTPLADGSATVTLSWTTEHAGTLILDPIHADVTGKESFEATIGRTTTFTLTAYGAESGGVDNLAIANATTTVILVLNSFAATPQAIAVDDFDGGQASVALQWSVDAPLRSELQLSSSVHGIYPTEFQSFGTTSLRVNEPQMFTLNVDGDTRWQDMWRLYVPAFSLRNSATANTGGAHAVAAPGASYVVVAQAADNQLAILSTASFSQIATVSCGSSPQGLVFSPDGSTLYVANQGDGTIGTVAVTASPQQTPPWSFAAGTAISVGGAPAQVALAPAGGYLYATVGAAGAPGTLAMVSLADRSVNNVPVGNDPYGLAVTPSGAQLFVANRGDGTVSQIGIAPNGTPQLIRTLAQLPGAAGLAVTPDGNTLLVACSDGTVQLLDATAPDTSPRTAIQVGGRPMDIALDPSGAYAFVTDSAGGQVSLVNIAKAAVIGSPVSVGASPLGISVSPDGMLVFVGHASTLTVLSLDTYTLRSNPPNCGGYVTDVAVSADGRSAFFWADASASIKGVAPAVGLHVYDVASETLRPALPNARIIGMAVASAAGNDAFLTQMGQSAVYPFDPLHVTLGAPLAIPAKNGFTQRQPMALAAAVDGSRVFALVSDGSHQFSIVVFSKGKGGYTLGADVTVYTASATPIAPRLAAAPDGSAAYAYDGTSGNLWSVTANGAGFTLGEPLHLGIAVAAGILPSPNGSTLYIAGQHQLSTVFFIVDCAAWTVQRLPLSEPVMTLTIRGMALSPDGTRILISDPTGGTIRFIDTGSMRFLQTIVDPGSFKAPGGTVMSPDQSRLFVTDQSGQVATAIQVRPATNQGA